jgi:Zn-dependent protease with chaperone function
VLFVVAACLTIVPLAFAARTVLKPGWNMFSTTQDSEVGQKVSQDAEQELPMLNNARVDAYLQRLGERLAPHAPGFKFQYAFKAVNDESINAFALPGGYIYMHRGVFAAADDESQLAGVMAHEISHVALRHGTNQASKASAAQMPLSILGGVMGGGSAAALTQLGAGFAVNSILLKHSRTAETQADVMGTQILHDAAINTQGMAQFFEKLQAQENGGRHVEFFSNHPSPERRVERVRTEIAGLGRPLARTTADTQEFRDIKRYVMALPGQAPARRELAGGNTGSTGSRRAAAPGLPSSKLIAFENNIVRLSHPDNWQAFGQGDAATFVPRGGMVEDARGNQALAYGVLINIYEAPPSARDYGQRLQGRGFGRGNAPTAATELEDATDSLVEAFRQSNGNMEVVRYHEPVRIDGINALSTMLSNDSPLAGLRETNRLVTMQHPDGLLFMVFTAPEEEFQGYDGAFQRMLQSARITR